VTAVATEHRLSLFGPRVLVGIFTALWMSPLFIGIKGYYSAKQFATPSEIDSREIGLLSGLSSGSSPRSGSSTPS
jgi:hypothetical protein